MKAPNTRGEEWTALEDEDCSQWQVCTQGEVVATGIFCAADARMMAASKKMAEAMHDFVMSDDVQGFHDRFVRILREAGYTGTTDREEEKSDVSFDNTQAYEEGWALFNGEIKRLDEGPIISDNPYIYSTEAPVFASDAEALAHVKFLADRDNSEYHKLALSLLKTASVN